MGVILESLPGDEIVCLMAFGGSPQGVRPSWETSREFAVGERLRYVSFFKYCKENHDESPADWMVVFDAADGKRYAATQTYFVTEECWRGLQEFFEKRLRRNQAKKSPRTPAKKTKKSRAKTMASTSRNRRK